MARSIADIVADIRSAIYGQTVRKAIADGIQLCYSDVNNAKTIADDAAALANLAASRASDASVSAEAIVDIYDSSVATVEETRAYLNIRT